jgi:SAM-dependent methyltransferase
VAFADHFSGHSEQYARARPRYPDALFEFVAAQAPARDAAWDCAPGSGQAAVGLARHFARVHATDASAEQIRNAEPHPRVTYSVQPAERTTLASASCDAVCVAQALHWFDRDAFYAEVRRVLRPGGVLAVWGYDRMRTADGLHEIFEDTILGALRPYWPAQNRLLWSGYKAVDFPFERIAAPPFEMRVEWTLEQLRAAWGSAPAREFTMPMHFLCGRHGSR